MTFIDSHCHFDFEQFDEDRDYQWKLAGERNVKGLLIPGIEPLQWDKAKAYATHYTGMRYAVGIHPWWLKTYHESLSFDLANSGPSNNAIRPFGNKLISGSLINSGLIGDNVIQKIEKHVSNERCVAIGECGLDKSIPLDMAIQQQYLDPFLALAKELNLPIILHCYKAHNELAVLLKRHNLNDARLNGVIHAFSGSLDLAKSYQKKGFLLGVGGTITYPRAAKTRHTVSQLSQNAIMLETDAPDMPLMGFQGHRNTPAQLVGIAESLATLRGESLAEVAEYTSRNAQALFGGFD